MEEESVLAGSMDEKGLSRWVGVDQVNRMEPTQGMQTEGCAQAKVWLGHEPEELRFWG